MPRMPAKDRFMKLVHLSPNGCWTWMSSIRGNYGMFWMNGASRTAHRVAWEFFKGPIPTGMFVCHKCDNGFCVNPQHLFLGTAQDNKDDMVSKGRERYGTNIPKGESSPHARLTEKTIAAIRDDKRPQSVIATAYGISQSHVSRIRTHQRWTN